MKTSSTPEITFKLRGHNAYGLGDSLACLIEHHSPSTFSIPSIITRDAPYLAKWCSANGISYSQVSGVLALFVKPTN